MFSRRIFFFFNQKTAYDMRISDWSSDVCSSDLVRAGGGIAQHAHDGVLDRLGDDVLPLAGFLVGVGPRQTQDVGEEALGEAMAAHGALGEALALVGEGDGVALDADELFLLEALDHLDRKSTRLNSSH